MPARLLCILLLLLPLGAQPWKRHTIDASSRGADGVRLLDADNDGLLDIATGWEEGGVVRIYRNPGPARAKQPWPKVTAGSVPSPEDAVLVDLDGDGRPEVLSATEGRSRTLFLHRAAKGDYWSDSSWTTLPVPASRDAMMWMFTAPARIGDSLRLFAGAKGPGAAIGLWTPGASPADPATWTWRSLLPAGWIMTLDPRDMDGDGDTDLLFSDRKGPARGIGWLENPGDAHRPWQRHNIGPAGEAEVMFAEPADLDGDGLEDVIAAVRPGTILACRRLDKSGKSWRTHAIQLPSIAGTAKAVAVGDIDLDGRPDLVFSCEQAMGSRHGVMWLSGSLPHRQWTPHEVSGPEGVKFDLVRLLDLDGDGDLDILTCEETENLGVIWYENPAR